MNRDAINPEVLAAAAQAFFDANARLNAAAAALAAVMLDQGVINSFEKVTEVAPDPDGCGLVQVAVEGLMSPFCLSISPQTGETRAA